MLKYNIQYCNIIIIYFVKKEKEKELGANILSLIEVYRIKNHLFSIE